ncbi:MAG TPA: transcription termination factor Rho [Planctomycetota bacterium]|nr:transcription termination factor Rho [Planctomycetota bacterium]
MMNQEQIKQRSRRGRRRRGRGGRHGGPPGAGGGQPWQAGPPRGDDVPFGPQQRIRVTGVLELTPDGQGWLRSIATSYVPEDTDPYLPVSLTRAANLRPGSEVDGWAERLRGRLTVVDVQAVDGLTPDKAAVLPLFKQLTSVDPTERFVLEGGEAVEGDNGATHNMRVLDLITPVGMGQRGLITASPRSGKTILLQQIANRISLAYPDVHLIVLLVDERPEEATHFRRSVKGEVIASTNDEPADRHTRVTELTIERAKRLVEAGKDVVIVMDSLTRLGRAYNVTIRNSGRTLSGGVDSRTLEKPKAFFGAARKVEGGGSLTILATALIETGSRMDEVIFEEFKGTGNMELVLSRELAERRIYPAIDINKSGTRKEELLLPADVYRKVVLLRRVLSQMHPVEAMQLLLAKVKETKTNEQFLASFDVRSY